MNVCNECLQELKNSEVIWCPDCGDSYCKDCIDNHECEPDEENY